MKYHLYFNKDEIGQTPILLIRKTIKEGFFKMEDSQKLEVLRVLSKYLSLYYDIEDIKDLSLVKGFYGVGGYSPIDKTIVLNKPSLVTFLHEYKHHLDFMRGDFNILDSDTIEDYARGYSHALYYNSTPNLFITAVKKGLIIYQKEI